MKTTLIPNGEKHLQAKYRSYLLRLWCADQDGECAWRASLEDPHTGEQIGFPNLEQLFAFLMEHDDGKPNASQVE